MANLRLTGIEIRRLNGIFDISLLDSRLYISNLVWAHEHSIPTLIEVDTNTFDRRIDTSTSSLNFLTTDIQLLNSLNMIPCALRDTRFLAFLNYDFSFTRARMDQVVLYSQQGFWLMNFRPFLLKLRRPLFDLINLSSVY